MNKAQTLSAASRALGCPDSSYVRGKRSSDKEGERRGFVHDRLHPAVLLTEENQGAKYEQGDR